MDSTEVAQTRKFFESLEEGLQKEIRRLAELVSGVNSRIGREFGVLREEMRKESAETRALLRSTLVDLDSRVSRLEAERRK